MRCTKGWLVRTMRSSQNKVIVPEQIEWFERSCRVTRVRRGAREGLGSRRGDQRLDRRVHTRAGEGRGPARRGTEAGAPEQALGLGAAEGATVESYRRRESAGNGGGRGAGGAGVGWATGRRGVVRFLRLQAAGRLVRRLRRAPASSGS